jgi:hypothetical protein
MRLRLPASPAQRYAGRRDAPPPARRNLGVQAAGAALAAIGILGWVTYKSPLGDSLRLLEIWIVPGFLLLAAIGLIVLFFGTVVRK